MFIVCLLFGDIVVNCPVCGGPLAKGAKSRHYCENERCPVIFVRCPYEPARTKIAYTSFAKKEIIEKIEKVTLHNMSHLS